VVTGRASMMPLTLNLIVKSTQH